MAGIGINVTAGFQHDHSGHENVDYIHDTLVNASAFIPTERRYDGKPIFITDGGDRGQWHMDNDLIGWTKDTGIAGTFWKTSGNTAVSAGSEVTGTGFNSMTLIGKFGGETNTMRMTSGSWSFRAKVDAEAANHAAITMSTLGVTLSAENKTSGIVEGRIWIDHLAVRVYAGTTAQQIAEFSSNSLKTLDTMNLQIGNTGGYGITTPGQGVLRINDAAVIPVGTMTSGGLLYNNGADLFYHNTAGTAINLTSGTSGWALTGTSTLTGATTIDTDGNGLTFTSSNDIYFQQTGATGGWQAYAFGDFARFYWRRTASNDEVVYIDSKINSFRHGVYVEKVGTGLHTTGIYGISYHTDANMKGFLSSYTLTGSVTTFVFKDTFDSEGFAYFADYSTNGIATHGDRWIPDKGYVDSVGGEPYVTINSASTLPTAVGDDAISIGESATAGGANGVAIGRVAEASGATTVAVGGAAKAASTGAVAVGYTAGSNGASADGDHSISIGYSSNSLDIGTQAIGIGRDANSIGDYAIAMGYQSSATGTDAIAIGADALTNAIGAIAIGNQAGSNGAGTDGGYSVTLGYNANQGTSNIGSNSIAIGRATDATATGAIAMGYSGVAAGDYAISLGYFGDATSNYGIALGYIAQSTATGAISIGQQTAAQSIDSVSLGTGAGFGTGTKGSYAIAIGYNAGSNNNQGAQSVAVGYNSDALGANSVAVGSTAQAAGARGTAIGPSASAAGADATALGSLANATLADSIAIGYATIGGQVGTIVLGRYSQATAQGAMMFGYHTSAQSNAVTDSVRFAWDGTTVLTFGKDLDMVYQGGLALSNTPTQIIKTVEVTLTTAQVKALFTTPITMVAAPGAGKWLYVMSAGLFLNYETATYVGTGGTDGDVHLYVGGIIMTTEGSISNPVFATADKHQNFIGVMGTGITPNAPIEISADNDFITGDSPITIYIQYVEITD